MIATSRLVFVAALCVASTAAQAAILVRVSGKGADAAGCGAVTAPCRTLQFAHDQVDAGGYIVAVDPADFGPVVIAKSINIANESSGAALTHTETAATAIDIASPASTVRLRGLTIEAAGAGISARTNATIDIQDCAIRASIGLQNGFSPTQEWFPRIMLSGVTIRDANAAMWLTSSSIHAKELRILNSGYGIFLSTPFVTTLVVDDSAITRTSAAPSPFGNAGISVSETVAVVRDTVISGYPTGLDARPAIFRLSRSTITNNGVAFKSQNTALPMIQSSGDSVIRGNADDALGLITPAALH